MYMYKYILVYIYICRLTDGYAIVHNCSTSSLSGTSFLWLATVEDERKGAGVVSQSGRRCEMQLS